MHGDPEPRLAHARHSRGDLAWQFAQGGVSPPIKMIRAYEQKIKDEERRKVDKLKSKHRLAKIRRMRKIGYRASNNKNEKHINKDEILLQAVQNKNSDEVHVMIKGGGDPEYEDSNGDALLHIAVRNDDADCVHALCDWKVSTETLTQKERVTATVLAAYCSGVKVMQELIDVGANCNAREPKRGRTAMMISLLKGKLDVFDALFDSGKANARLADLKGWTCLMIASKFGLNEQVKKLLTFPKLYMEIDLKEYENGCTALMLAAKEGHYDTCEILLKHRASKTKLLILTWMNARMNWAVVMFGREKKNDQRALVAMLHPKILFRSHAL